MQAFTVLMNESDFYQSVSVVEIYLRHYLNEISPFFLALSIKLLHN